MDVWMYGCVDVWMYGHMDVWMYIHVYTCIYIYLSREIIIGGDSGGRGRSRGLGGGCDGGGRSGGRGGGRGSSGGGSSRRSTGIIDHYHFCYHLLPSIINVYHYNSCSLMGIVMHYPAFSTISILGFYSYCLLKYSYFSMTLYCKYIRYIYIYIDR